MLVPVVDVRQMRMDVGQRRMDMRMRMRLGAFHSIMLVLMVFVVGMHMTVRQAFMRVLVFMMFGQYEPCCKNHEQQCRHENDGKRFVEKQD